jgi:hypothetical protein
VKVSPCRGHANLDMAKHWNDTTTARILGNVSYSLGINRTQSEQWGSQTAVVAKVSWR